MSTKDRSTFLLHDFELSAVRLKRKLRLILNKDLRRNKITNENVTLNEFAFYLGNLITFFDRFHQYLCSISSHCDGDLYYECYYSRYFLCR